MNRNIKRIIVALVALAALEFGVLGAGAAGIGGGDSPRVPPIAQRRASPTPAPRTPTDLVSPASIQITPDRTAIRCDGADSARITIRLTDRRGKAVPDGTAVYFSVFNGSASPAFTSTHKGVATVQIVIYGDGYSYQPNVVITASHLEAGLRIRCFPDSGACPVSPGGDCGPFSPPCEPRSPGSVSPPCPTPTPTPYPCNPSPGSGPLSPPCGTPEPPLSPPPCDVSPPSVSPPCGTPPPSPPTCDVSPPSVSPPCGPPPPVSPSGSFTLAIDCDVQRGGIQSSCDVPRGKGTLDVAVVATNDTGEPRSLGAFGFNMRDSSIARLLPLAGADNRLDGNPDFNNALGGIWDCAPPPNPDTGADGNAAAVSFIGCYLTGGYGAQQVLAPGQSITLATVHYAIPANAPAGAAYLTLGIASMYSGEPEFAELGSCEPGLNVPITCPSATVSLTTEARTTTPPPAPTARRTPPAATRTRERN